MKMNTPWMGFVFLCALLIWAGVSEGQVMPSQRGGAIDANNQLGSGGYNSPVRTYVPNAANLFMTGNVAGGRGFRGFSPIHSSSSLYMSLPSSSMSNFRADSIGIGDVTRGRTNYQFNPYFDYSNTVANVGVISAGRNQPGSTMPLSPYTLPSLPGFRDASDPTAITRLNEVDPGYNPARNSLPVGLDPYSSTPASYQQRMEDPQRHLAKSSLFGVDVEDPQNLAIYDQQRLNDLLRDNVEPDRQYEADERRRDEAEVIEDAGQFDFLRPAEEGGEPTIPSPDSSVTRPLNPVLAEEADAATYQAEGVNVYDDFREAIQYLDNQQQAGDEGTADSANQESVNLALENARRVYRSLAGDSNDMMNRSILEAERLVHEGNYYRAVDSYRQAALQDPDNALIYLGWGNALLCAGDYTGALSQLTRGIELFPEIGRFRMDLPSFLDDPSILEVRRADLEKRLSSKEDYRLRFLLGWMEYYSGLEKYGVPNLEKAASEAPVNSVISKFPGLLKSSTEGKATPSGEPAAH